MKRFLVFCFLSCLLVLFWCFHKKQDTEEVVVIAPEENPIIATGKVDKPIWTWEEVILWKDAAAELNEQGEFDPKKFQDDEIDEVMDVLEELLE